MFGMSLVLNVSLDTQTPSAPDPASWLRMSVQQKDATLLPLVRLATDCVVRKVAADPRYQADMRPDDFNHMIDHSTGACAPPVRAMIVTPDRMYGNGSGEPSCSDPIRRAAVGGREAGQGEDAALVIKSNT